MSNVGSLLTAYRKSRRLSQLELGLMANVSSRHISFIENGRSSPSRDMLLRLADVLELPLRDSNLLLTSAGFAMNYSQHSLDAREMHPVREALEIILHNHNPYPALVLDACWNVVLINEAQGKVFAALPDRSPAKNIQKSQSQNLLKLVFDEAGFRSLICNWEELAAILLRRLKKQVLAYKRPEAEVLLRELLAMDPPAQWEQPTLPNFEGPMATTQIRVGEKKLSLFSTLTQFGTALDVGMEELVIESYFPADSETKQFFTALM